MGRHQENPPHTSSINKNSRDHIMSSEPEPCPLCLGPMLVRSVGECDHAVCLVCSTRMRVLALKNECALCRRDLQTVVFTQSRAVFSQLKNKVLLADRKY